MVKGISRQIIEVQETGNPYYEKAYFVVKPAYDDAERAVLEKEARKLLKKMDAPGALRKRARRTLLLAAYLAACFLLGGVLSYLLFHTC